MVVFELRFNLSGWSWQGISSRHVVWTLTFAGYSKTWDPWWFRLILLLPLVVLLLLPDFEHELFRVERVYQGRIILQ